MSKKCPVAGRLSVYLDCLECNRKQDCSQGKIKYNTICVGIDQSYKRTGISVSADGVLKKVSYIDLEKYKNKSEKRKALKQKLEHICNSLKPAAMQVICIYERIRLHSEGFLNIDYIKTIGALNAVIADVMYEYDIPVYSVDTRCWKASVIGTSKKASNNYGVPEEKWPTVLWCIKQGFKDSITLEVYGRREKGTFMKDGKKYEYNNDAADSAGIAMFYFVGDKAKLKAES